MADEVTEPLVEHAHELGEHAAKLDVVESGQDAIALAVASVNSSVELLRSDLQNATGSIHSRLDALESAGTKTEETVADAPSKAQETSTEAVDPPAEVAPE